MAHQDEACSARKLFDGSSERAEEGDCISPL